MKREQGSVTLWMLGLVILVFGVGALSIDLWNVFAQRRTLVAVADAAAVAGASGIDEVHFRETGIVVLDPERAYARAMQSLQDTPDVAGIEVMDVAIVGDEVRVAVWSKADLTLLGLLTPYESIDVAGHAVARAIALP